MLFAHQLAGPSSLASRGARHHLVLPRGAGDETGVCDAAAHLIEAARAHMAERARGDVDVLVVEPGSGRVRALGERGAFEAPEARFQGARVQVLFNLAFLLADPPPLSALVARADAFGWALAGARSTRDTQAIAFVPARTPAALLREALRHLAARVGDDVEGSWRTLSSEPLVPASPALPEHSPALGGMPGAWARRPPESPRYLNTALDELLQKPADRGLVAGDPRRLARALARQRASSRVPFVFNTLLNDIELRLGTPEPESFPPELHLSLPGACATECRSCGQRREARGEHAPQARLEQLDFLRHARALRFDGGPGEPTLDARLPALVALAAERHPHLRLSLATDGVSLREAMIQALVGRAAWVNLSLDAATRETWRELHRADLFEQVCANVKALTRKKRERRALLPLLCASVALDRRNVAELTRLPALCRELGVDRLTAFSPAGRAARAAAAALEACHAAYGGVYDETLRQAERHAVTVELPLPSSVRTALGLEPRSLHDFARIETDERALGRLLGTLRFAAAPGERCAFLWRQAAVGSARVDGAASHEMYFLYPCAGLLRHADHLPLPFAGSAAFAELWRRPLLQRLRRAPRQRGVSPECDACDAGEARQTARPARKVEGHVAETWAAPEPLAIR